LKDFNPLHSTDPVDCSQRQKTDYSNVNSNRHTNANPTLLTDPYPLTLTTTNSPYLPYCPYRRKLTLTLPLTVNPNANANANPTP